MLNFEELIRSNGKVYMKATDKENFFVSLSSIEARYGSHSDDKHLYYGTWKTIPASRKGLSLSF